MYTNYISLVCLQNKHQIRDCELNKEVKRRYILKAYDHLPLWGSRNVELGNGLDLQLKYCNRNRKEGAKLKEAELLNWKIISSF